MWPIPGSSWAAAPSALQRQRLRPQRYRLRDRGGVIQCSAGSSSADGLLTLYGQLIVKWQVSQAGRLPAATGDKLDYLLRLAINPWIFSVSAAFIAALSWMAAMSRLELSRAYPFVGLSFVLILVRARSSSMSR